MEKTKQSGISSFQKYLTLWVFACMVIGILIGKFAPAVPAALGKLEIAGISIPIAILIWVMIYPMMLKVDFQSVRQVGRNPKRRFVTRVQVVKQKGCRILKKSLFTSLIMRQRLACC